LSLDDALALIQRRRPEAQPIPAFWTMLKQHEQTLTTENKRKGDEKIGGESVNKRARQGPAPAGPAIAAIGPSIGPQSPPRKTEQMKPFGPQPPTSSSSFGTTKKSIGPQMPPRAEADSVTTIGPQPPPESIVCPQPPTPTNLVLNMTVSSQAAEAAAGAIGPQPPTPEGDDYTGEPKLIGLGRV
jgi:hypothetical protein